jgi:hypothetical protein
MLNAEQTYLRAARIRRPITGRERRRRAAPWLASGFVISGLVWGIGGRELLDVVGGIEMLALTAIPILVSLPGAAKAYRVQEITELTPEGLEEVRLARGRDRAAMLKKTEALTKSWYGRFVASVLVIGACWLYISSSLDISRDEKFILGLIAIAALIWAWETALVMLAIWGLWGLTQLSWHLSTPSAVLLGALIIAGAIKSKR